MFQSPYLNLLSGQQSRFSLAVAKGLHPGYKVLTFWGLFQFQTWVRGIQGTLSNLGVGFLASKASWSFEQSVQCSYLVL